LKAGSCCLLDRWGSNPEGSDNEVEILTGPLRGLIQQDKNSPKNHQGKLLVVEVINDFLTKIFCGSFKPVNLLNLCRPNPAIENMGLTADSATLIRRESQNLRVRVTKVQIPCLQTRLKFCLFSMRFPLMLLLS